MAGLDLTTQNRTDAGNAERLMLRCGQALYWTDAWGWLVYDDETGCWKRDKLQRLQKMCVRTMRDYLTQATKIEDDRKRKDHMYYALQSENAKGVTAMIKSAQHLRATTTEYFDADRRLINLRNGAFVMRQPEWRFREHSRELMLTKNAGVEYDAKATCPTWEAFLDKALDGSQADISFIQRAIGYSLTGDVSEKCFFLVYGPTDTGKTVFIEVLHLLLGDYAVKMIDEDMMLRHSRGSNNDGVANLVGARVATLSETAEGERLNVSLIKLLTGGGKVTGRRKYEHEFTYMPQMKFWIDTNHKPRITDTDDAIWGRLRPIPFVVQIPKNQQDRHLLAKFKAEAPGILNWALEGCKQWLEHGLGTTAHIEKALDEYRNDEDLLAQWLRDCCVHDRGDGSAQELFQEYKRWSNEQSITMPKFKARLAAKGYEQKRNSRGLVWIGLDIDPNREFQQ